MQLSFADDLMVMCKTNSQSFSLIKQHLNSFSVVFDLMVNQAKSSIMIAGVSNAV